jgi:hypothetical protein
MEANMGKGVLFVAAVPLAILLLSACSESPDAGLSNEESTADPPSGAEMDAEEIAEEIAEEASELRISSRVSCKRLDSKACATKCAEAGVSCEVRHPHQYNRDIGAGDLRRCGTNPQFCTYKYKNGDSCFVHVSTSFALCVPKSERRARP